MSWRCMLRGQPYQVRCLVARARRMAAALPTVWEAFRRGEMDADQMRVIDRVARRVTETATLAAIDEQAVDAADTRSPKQLQVWLLRLVVQLEPLAFAQRHRRALAERRVTVVQGTDGDGLCHRRGLRRRRRRHRRTARRHLQKPGRGGSAHRPATPRRPVRRPAPRPDRLRPTRRREGRRRRRGRGPRAGGGGRGGSDQDLAEHSRASAEEADDQDVTEHSGASAEERAVDWLEVEDIDPDTGELLGTHLQRLDAEGETVGEPVDASSTGKPSLRPRVIKRPRTIRIGVVVPLASLLDASETPGELADRSGFIPGDILKDQISDALANAGDQVLFTRLLTDNGGRLLDVTELGGRPSARLAEAINIRAGSCRFPTCTVPANRCDLDHHQPLPHGETSGRNMDPFCRRHHRGKTFAWLAAHRDDHGVDWTMPDAEHYRCIDQPLPTGRAA